MGQLSYPGPYCCRTSAAYVTGNIPVKNWKEMSKTVMRKVKFSRYRPEQALGDPVG